MKKLVPPMKKLYMPAFIIMMVSLINIFHSLTYIADTFIYLSIIPPQIILLFIATLITIFGGLLIMFGKKIGIPAIIIGLIGQIIYAFYFMIDMAWTTLTCEEGEWCAYPPLAYLYVFYAIILIVLFIWITMHLRFQYIKTMYK